MAFRLKNSKLNKDDIRHLRLLVVFRKAVSGDVLLNLAYTEGGEEVTLDSILRSDVGQQRTRHPTAVRTTYLLNDEAVDPGADLWSLASVESTEGRVTTKRVDISVVYCSRIVRIVPFVSLGDRRPSVALRDFVFDIQTPSRSKVLLRDIASEWLGQVRGCSCEMSHVFGLLLEELVDTNRVARKRDLLYGLDLDGAGDILEQHVTIVFESDHPPRCKLNDKNRVDDPLSPQVLHRLERDLREHFQSAM